MNKPPFRVARMTEIAALPWNGRKVVSTFSGCGGSCLGFKMAGFRVVWANEFIPAAAETYRANHTDTPLDCRDIREVEPSEILEATGLAPGEIDVLEGSPPCASFSTAGKRSKGWGLVKDYSDTTQRTDDLFFEFARILAGLQPKAFVAENVSGLVKGVAKGYFLEILRTLKAAGYKVAVRVLDAQWLGVPQARQRTIFVGVRDDLQPEPVHPAPLSYRYSVRDACPWIVRGKYGPTWKPATEPSPTVSASMNWNPATSHQGLELVEAEPSNDDPEAPDISRFAIGKEWDRLPVGGQSGKYMNLVRADPAEPSPTICASHGQPGIAGVTHPYERRKFTIAELRRICGFPDDFILTGSYTQQWERLGRSVPPVMMSRIAETLRDQVFAHLP